MQPNHNTKIGILFLLFLIITILFYTQYLASNSNNQSLSTSAKVYNQSPAPTCAPPPRRCPQGGTCSNGLCVVTPADALCGRDFSCPNALICLQGFNTSDNGISYKCSNINKVEFDFDGKGIYGDDWVTYNGPLKIKSNDNDFTLNEKDELDIFLKTNIAPKVGVIGIRCGGSLRMIIPDKDSPIISLAYGKYGMQIPCAYSGFDKFRGQFVGDQIIVKLWIFKSAQEAKVAQSAGVEPVTKALVELRRDIRVQKSPVFYKSENKECLIRGNVQINYDPTRPPKKIYITLDRPYLDNKTFSRAGTGFMQTINNPISGKTYSYLFTNLEEMIKYKLAAYSVYDENDPYQFQYKIPIADNKCESNKDNSCTLLPTCIDSQADFEKFGR